MYRPGGSARWAKCPSYVCSPTVKWVPGNVPTASSKKSFRRSFSVEGAMCFRYGNKGTIDAS